MSADLVARLRDLARQYAPNNGGYSSIELYQRLNEAADALERCREEALEEAAKIAGVFANECNELQATHYRYTDKPFNPADFGLDREVIKWSRYAADKIRALKSAGKPGSARQHSETK